MSDNSYSTNFGPSTPGALNLVSGQTHGATGPSTEVAAGGVTGDPQPTGDVCTSRENVTMSGRNIGNLLNDTGVHWGWFNGGFHTADGKPACAQSHAGADGKPKTDYIPHHEPFQYYASTANPQHLPPSSVSMIGKPGDQAKHQYDLTDFWAAMAAHNMPAVSFLKAPGYQDGHAGYSTRGSRSWSCPRSRSRTSSTTRRPTRPRSRGSSRTTGAPGGSATRHSTRRPAR
jgi:phospholipase C